MYSDEQSNEILSSQQNLNDSEESDLEINNISTNHHAEAAAALYIKSKLVGEMGFDYHLVDNLLKYEKGIIRNDIQRAVDFCIKTDEGWKHTFIPDESDSNSSRYHDSAFEEEYSNDEFRIKCLICGEGIEEHQRVTIRFPETRRIVENSFSTQDELEISYKEEVKNSETSNENKIKDQIIEEAEVEEPEEIIDPNEDKILCNICYCEHNVSKTYSLLCCHTFGLRCLRQMLSVSIKEGKVIDNKCPQYDCDQKYEENDIKSIITDKRLIEKYEKFKLNIEINLDKTKQWCPIPNCGLWVKGSQRKPKVECSNGHQFCFNCQQGWHKGNCKDHLDGQFINWASENNVSRCPKCNIKTEKNSGCNHMTCICGYQWCWLCKNKYSDIHYKRWNVFGCGSMQYTVGWSKCGILLYYTALILLMFPLFLLCCPMIYMIKGACNPKEYYDNCCSPFCCIPKCVVGYNYRPSCLQALCIGCCYLPLLLVFGLLFGVLIFAICYPFAIIYTLWKMLCFSIRDCRCFQSAK